MENDRELLEFAAKAAGMELVAKGNHYRNSDGAIYPFGGANGWNPLTDDSDALRLACAIGLSVDINNAFCKTTVIFDCGSDVSEDHTDGTAAATRRAIVRAAAEIGKEMNRG